MTTTSILSHQPPLKTRNPVFLCTNYYGSVGRPCNGKRKSAVELLQESKAYYVKSESVLDTKQELKTADHLRVRSPTVDDLAILKEGTHSASYAFAVCPICSPYHYHQCHPYATTTSARGRFAHIELDALEKHYLAHYHRSRKENRENGAGWSCNNRINRSQERRSSVPTSTSTNSFPTFYLKPLQIQKDILTTANSFGGSSKSFVGMHSCHQEQPPPPSHPTASSSLSTSVSPQQRHSSVSSTSTSSRRRRAAATNTVATSTTIDKVPSSAPPILTTVSSSSPQSLSSHGYHREKKDEVRESPPPLPPKSPRTTKPVRPQDFPQRLPGPGYPPEILPPPPPRRTTSSSEYHQPQVLHAKYNRSTIPHEKPSASRKRNEYDGIPIKLLSPILVPTPPPDVTMESPMSDTFPIISPPPAFSTPVTPMLDRQNSTTSDKSEKKHGSGATKLPLSATVSAVSSMSSGKSRKSTPTDVSMGYVSPRSPVDLDISSKNSTIETEQSESIQTTNEEESSMECRNVERGSTTDSSPTPAAKSILVSKRSPIPKSVTENALYNVCNKCDGVPVTTSSQNRSAAAQLPPTNQAHGDVAKSNEHLPRRPILRSKSDLSHRYKKAASSFNLIGGLGFTLVHVDLGLNGSPPPPIHISSSCQTQIPQQPPVAFRNTSSTSTQMDSSAGPGARSSADLEKFFDMLGLDNQSLLESSLPQNSHADLLSVNNGKRSGGSSPVFFSSVSSIESEPRRGGSVDSGDSPIGPPKVIGTRTVGGSGDYATTTSILQSGNNVSNGVSSSGSLFIQHGEPSIVERNARVIKWLYNCRKAVEMSKR